MSSPRYVRFRPIADIRRAGHYRLMEVTEFKVLLSSDRRGRVAIVRRKDGRFCLYEWWHWDVETQRLMRVEPIEEGLWSTACNSAIYEGKEPLAGIYGTIEDAEREAKRRLELHVG